VRAPQSVSIAFSFHCPNFLGSSWLAMVANAYTMIDKPHEDPNIRGDPYKTLLIARLSYDATEQDLEREFGRFGPIERVCLRIHTKFNQS
jgi:hypothetical protein